LPACSRAAHSINLALVIRRTNLGAGARDAALVDGAIRVGAARSLGAHPVHAVTRAAEEVVGTGTTCSQTGDADAFSHWSKLAATATTTVGASQTAH
jgi:hypothetical protein